MIERIPSGYEITESVNGVVSLARARTLLKILDDEVTLIDKALKRHPNGSNYRMDVKRNQIIIYEGNGQDVDGILALFGRTFHDLRSNQAAQSPIGKLHPFQGGNAFILTDPGERLYGAERWCYSVSIDDWISVGKSAKLERLGTQSDPYSGYRRVL